MLDAQKTLDLIKQAQQGSESAKEILITENSPLIKSVIKIYKNKGVEYDDLFQLGAMGFLKAINKFDTAFDVKFSTYAVPMIAGEVKRFLRDDGSIKVSRAIKSLGIQINKFISAFKKENGDAPTIEQIAKEFSIDTQEVIFAMDSQKALVSLDEKQDEDNSKSRSLMEVIEDKNASDNMLDNLALKEAIKDLSLRDKQIISLRFFQDKTQSQIARILNVSQVQVSRLENKILEKIKSRLN